MNIDIIIPFKDAENHLPNICHDLCLQTYNNFQVTFISDNSTDGSIAYLENTPFLFKHEILKSHGDGPGSARNKGISNTSQDYLCFIDADDRVEINFIEEFSSSAINTNADIIECMYKSVTPSGDIISGTNIESFISNKNRFIGLLDGSLPRLSWGKLYKREYLESVNGYFPDGIHNGEDHIFLLNAYNGNPKIELIFKKLYSWIRHSNSLTNRPPTIKTIEDFIKVSEFKSEIFEINKNTHPENELSSLTFSRRFFKEARMLQQQIKDNSPTPDELISEIQKKIMESEKLQKTKDDIIHDSTSYWKDVMQ